MPQSKKKTKATKKKRPRSSRASWSEGERRTYREAVRAGAKPVGDIADLAFLTPEEGDELLSAIREMREQDRQAAPEKAWHLLFARWPAATGRDSITSVK